MADNFKGVGDFVAALMGGGGIREDARVKQETALVGQDTARARLDKALSDAAMQRQQAQAYERLGSADFSAAGLNPAEGDLARILLLAGGGNAAALTSGVGNLFETARRKAALEAAVGGDMGAANANLTSLANAPVPTVDVDNGYILTDRFSNDPTVTQTDEAAGRALALAALANARNAQAGASGARADLYQRTDPNRPRGKGAAAPVNPPNVSIDASVPAVVAGDIRASPDKWAAAPSVERATAAGRAGLPVRAFSPAEATQALLDAREAVARGAMTADQARQRLIDAGLDNIAGRL